MAPLPVGALLMAGIVVLVLLGVAGRYGFHRDEFYFVVTGQHPAVAAPDNPMLVPYLAAGWYAVVGGHLWAFRILPALAVGGYVLVGAATARVLGASRRHQVAAAAGTALLGVVPPVGHLFSTTTFDMLATAAAVCLLIRAVRCEPQRWSPWLWCGVMTGVALEIKVLAAPLMACALAGILLLGPRPPLRSARPWVAALIAAVIAAPNLVWQATHGWPQLTVAANIAAGGSGSSTSRAALIPVTALEIGPIVVIVLVIGVVRLLRSAERHRTGWLGIGFLLFVALMLLTGGKAYYPAGFYPALMAAGSGPVLDWALRSGGRRLLAAGLAAVSILVTAALTLPLFPVGSPGYKMALGPNPDMGETVGWTGYDATVTGVARRLPRQDRAHTIVLASNYGEAGSLYLARQRGAALPPVYSGHNAFWSWGPPPRDAADAIVVGDFSDTQLSGWYAHCTLRARLVSPRGADNSEDGAPVRWCTGRTQDWARLWPKVKQLG